MFDNFGQKVIIGALQKKIEQLDPHELVQIIETEFHANMALLRGSIDATTGKSELELIEQDFQRALSEMRDAFTRIQSVKSHSGTITSQ